MLAVLAAMPGGLSLPEVGALLAVGGAGLGVMYPMTTTIVQNAVAPHQLGIATGALNFAAPARRRDHRRGVRRHRARRRRHRRPRADARHAARRRRSRARDFAEVFRWLFAAGAVFLAAGLIAVLGIEEQPLRGPRSEHRRGDG